MTYQDIIHHFTKNPQDIQTVPIHRREGHWFYTFTKDQTVYVQSAKVRQPKCNITGCRPLNHTEFETMLQIYHRRCNGEQVSHHAVRASRNQVYWFGIFSALGM